MQPEKAVSRKVLVLGEETRIILPIIRSLGRRGVGVHVGWCSPDEPALRSRYVSKVHEIAPYTPRRQDWREDLSRTLSEEDFDLVLPATEASVFPLQNHRHEVEKLGRFHLLSERAFEVAFDKTKTYELAKALEIPVPKSRVLRAADTPAAIAAEFSFPLLLKPSCSVDQEDVRVKHFVHKVCTAEDLERQLERRRGEGQTLFVQENIPGRGTGVELLAEGGEVLYAFQHVRLHETSGYGSMYRQSVALDPQLLEAACALTKALDYTGVLMVEFRTDPPTGRWALLELNARFWGSLPLAVAAGADFPWFLFLLLTTGRRSFPDPYKEGIRCRNFLNDMRWTWRSLRRKGTTAERSTPTEEGWEINHVSRWQLLRDVARAVTFRDHVDVFALDDPRPGWAEWKQLCRIAKTRGRPRPGSPATAQGASE